jgi:GTP cyclohydrolase II
MVKGKNQSSTTTLTRFNTLCPQSPLSSDTRYAHLFHLRGTLNLQVYMHMHDKLTLRDLLNRLKEECEAQFRHRIDLFQDEADNQGKLFRHTHFV